MLYQEDFIEPVDLSDVDFKHISSNTGRKVAHYGYKYDYLKKVLTKCEPIPDYLNFNDEISQYLGYDINFDQLIINEYKPGQGISPHIDDVNLFGPVIACISLGCKGVIKCNGNHMVKPCSIYILQDDYRYKHKHSYKNSYDKTRYSLTYRCVNK